MAFAFGSCTSTTLMRESLHILSPEPTASVGPSGRDPAGFCPSENGSGRDAPQQSRFLCGSVLRERVGNSLRDDFVAHDCHAKV